MSTDWEQAFRVWAADNHFRPYTAEQTLTGARSAMRAMLAGAPLSPWMRVPARRLALFCEQTDYLPDFAEWLALQGIKPLERTPLPKKNRKLEARSLTEADWGKLQDAVAESDALEDAVIHVICLSGLRVGDALRITRATLARGLDSDVLYLERKGGIVKPVPIAVREPWARLHTLIVDQRADNVAGMLCSSNASPLPGQCAYKRMDRRLKKLAKDLKLGGRMHTHKLRRTVAVRAIRATNGDISKVQNLLGHHSSLTTQKYVDETREVEVAELQRRMWKS